MSTVHSVRVKPLTMFNKEPKAGFRLGRRGPSKQFKLFCILAPKALPALERKDVRAVYKSINDGTNDIFYDLDDAAHALEQKIKLDLVIENYNSLINDTSLFTIDERNRAKSHLQQDIFTESTTKLILSIEAAFNLEARSLFPTSDAPPVQVNLPESKEKLHAKSKLKRRSKTIRTLKWKNVIVCIRHEMSAVMSTSMEAAVRSANVRDLNNESVTRVLCEMQKRMHLTNTEATYIRNAVKRAIRYSTPQDMKGVTRSENALHGDSGAFCTQKEALNSDMIFDIYCVKKTHKFSFEQRAEYKFANLLDDVKSAEKELEAIGLCDGVAGLKFSERINGVSLYPSWLIDDVIFDVMEWGFATSGFVDSLHREGQPLSVRMRVIPQSIVGLYNKECVWKLKDISFSLNKADKALCGMQMVPVSANLSVQDKYKLIRRIYDNIATETTGDWVILVDRRRSSKEKVNAQETLWIFQCADKRALNALDRNNLFGFDFEVGHVVKTWCRFGEYQRIRFFPEYITYLIPRLFVSPDMSPKDYLMKIYDSDFKHQWRVHLDDPTFNLYYKAITGDDHISNNYYRESLTHALHIEQTLGFWEYVRRQTSPSVLQYLNQWHIEHEMDSDAVFYDLVETDDNGKSLFIEENDSNLGQWAQRDIGDERTYWSVMKAMRHWKKIDCTSKNGTTLDVKDCRHFEVLLHYLRAFKMSGYKVDASNLAQFNLGEFIASVDHIVSVHHLMVPERRAEIHRFITSQLMCEEMEQCRVLFQHVNRIRERAENEDVVPVAVDMIERECAVMNDVLNSVHALLLHRDQNQWRGSNQRFGTEVIGTEEKKEDEEVKQEFPRAIEFGESVLRWIPFGELPYFRSLRDEIVNNEESSIDEELFERYLIECIQKMSGTKFSLREMLALKLYTDTTVFTTFLRRAHWKNSPLSMRKMYYFWASALYEAALYHSVPIPSVNGKSPQTIFHGLDRVFTVHDEQHKYHGPFSSSTLRTVAHRFSKETGLYFRIMPSYSNPLQCCLGINMETISCFKHEREILLVDQYIPIRSAKTFQSNQYVLVDLLLFTVKGRKSEIRDRDNFFQKLGIRFDSRWMPLIMGHSELFALSAFGGRLVIARLYMELDIWYQHWVPIKMNKENADKELLIYCVEQRKMKKLLPLYAVLMSRFKVFQSQTIGICWRVDFEPFSESQDVYHDDMSTYFENTEYCVNGKHISHGVPEDDFWRFNQVIRRIECRNSELFGNQVVWTETFDSSMDADPKEFLKLQDSRPSMNPGATTGRVRRRASRMDKVKTEESPGPNYRKYALTGTELAAGFHRFPQDSTVFQDSKQDSRIPKRIRKRKAIVIKTCRSTNTNLKVRRKDQ